MLAVLTDERFSDERWLFERKLDGIRCLAFRTGQRLRLLSRNREEQNTTYPELIEPLLHQSVTNFVVDGEVIAFEGKRTSFSRLQQRSGIKNAEAARRTGVAVYYYLFDVLHVEGFDTTALALRDRKALLEHTFTFADPLRFSKHWNTEGEKYYRRACQLGWEGLIAKRADGPYESRRSSDWLKFKCENQQELVIGGYTAPKGKRIGFGALLLGYYERGQFRYAGKVGTGYDDATLRGLGRRLASLKTKASPFTNPEQVQRNGVTWVKPTLVAEVGFTEWTGDGKLRHPRYLGLRSDKPARAVVRERSR